MLMKATNLQVTVLIDKDVTRFLQIFVSENDHGAEEGQETHEIAVHDSRGVDIF